jgi:predicted small secreted protein
MRKTAIVCASLLSLSLLSACGTTGTGSEEMMKAGGSSEIEQLIKEADAAIKKAASVDGQWRDSSGKYLKQAKAALSKGDLDTAKKIG